MLKITLHDSSEELRFRLVAVPVPVVEIVNGRHRVMRLGQVRIKLQRSLGRGPAPIEAQKRKWPQRGLRPLAE